MAVYCFGELLIDLLAREQGVELARVAGFDRSAGGAPANVAADLAALGVEARFMGLLGGDAFGRFLREHLERGRVGGEWLRVSERIVTPLAFLATLPGGAKEVSFAGMDAWASALAALVEFDAALIPGPDRWLHVGGVASAWPELHHRQRAMLTRARRGGWRTSLDVNFRPALYANHADVFARRMAELIPLADVVKVSAEELPAALGPGDWADEAALDRLLSAGASVAAITRGPGGCAVKARGRSMIDLPAVPVDSAEPTGAGDAFCAALIAALARAGGAPGGGLSWPAEHELNFAANLANECGALAMTGPGSAINLRNAPAKSFPALAQWKREMKQGG